jgi:hypothetical protein
MSTPYGYDIDELDAPKFVSRGEWDISGTYEIEAYTPLKAVANLTSGMFGSGAYEVRQWAQPYDDISGTSGCIGITLRRIRKSTQSGISYINENIGRRKMAVMHEGYAFMRYESGTLDGTVVTLKYGDWIAPCTSGFRAFQEINIKNVTGESDTEVVLTTGTRQVKLGWYADVQSNATGTRKRVKIMPNMIYGQYV